MTRWLDPIRETQANLIAENERLREENDTLRAVNEAQAEQVTYWKGEAKAWETVALANGVSAEHWRERMRQEQQQRALMARSGE